MVNTVKNFSTVDSLEELKVLVDTLMSSDDHVGFDIETGYSGGPYPKRSLNSYHPKQFICGFSVTNSPGWARYVPVLHDFHDNNLDPEKSWELVKPVLETKTIVAHNIVFEARNLRMLEEKGHGPRIDINVAKSHDSMIQAFVLSDVPKMLVSPEWWDFEPEDTPGFPLIPALHRGNCDQCHSPVLVDVLEALGGVCASCATNHGQDVEAIIKDIKESGGKTNTVWGIGLKDLTHFRYGYRQAHIETLFGEKLTKAQTDSMRFNVLPINADVVSYACDDAAWCLQLSQDQLRRIHDHKHMDNGQPFLKFIYDLEMEVADVLVDMSVAGISVDWNGIHSNKAKFETFYGDMQSRTRKLFEEESGKSLADLNFNSVPQMRKLLFEDMQLESSVMTEKNAKSTSDKALTLLRRQSKAVDQLLLTRQTKKMGDFFVMWNKLTSDAFDGKIHPGFGQTTVPSGRFNSDSPNVQQITKNWWFQTIEGSQDDVMRQGPEFYWTGNARTFLIPSPEFRLLSFDFQAAEMRVLAGLADEPNLKEAFANSEDVHLRAASLAFSKPLDKVTPEERQNAKAVGFGLIYQQGPKALSDGLGITYQEAKDIQNKYLSGLPSVNKWFQKVKDDARIRKVLNNPMGRRVTLWESFHENTGVVAKAERLAVNMPVQGTAADYAKLGMILVARKMKERGWWGDKVKLLMNQHDSLVFEVHESLDLVEVRDELEKCVQFPMPTFLQLEDFPDMDTEWEVGVNWGDLMVEFDNREFLDMEEVTFSVVPSKKTILKVMDTLRRYGGGETEVKIEVSGQVLPTGFKVYLNDKLVKDLKKVGAVL